MDYTDEQKKIKAEKEAKAEEERRALRAAFARELPFSDK
jgi:hypothetical protein